MYKKMMRFMKHRPAANRRIFRDAVATLPEPTQITCARRDTIVTPTLSQAGPHTKASCPICGKYIKFVRKPP